MTIFNYWRRPCVLIHLRWGPLCVVCSPLLKTMCPHASKVRSVVHCVQSITEGDHVFSSIWGEVRYALCAVHYWRRPCVLIHLTSGPLCIVCSPLLKETMCPHPSDFRSVVHCVQSIVKKSIMKPCIVFIYLFKFKTSF